MRLLTTLLRSPRQPTIRWIVGWTSLDVSARSTPIPDTPRSPVAPAPGIQPRTTTPRRRRRPPWDADERELRGSDRRHLGVASLTATGIKKSLRGRDRSVDREEVWPRFRVGCFDQMPHVGDQERTAETVRRKVGAAFDRWSAHRHRPSTAVVAGGERDTGLVGDRGQPSLHLSRRRHRRSTLANAPARGAHDWQDRRSATGGAQSTAHLPRADTLRRGRRRPGLGKVDSRARKRGTAVGGFPPSSSGGRR